MMKAEDSPLHSLILAQAVVLLLNLGVQVSQDIDECLMG